MNSGASHATRPASLNDAESLREDFPRRAAEDAENLLAIGEPLLAYNALQNALQQKPDDLRLRQLRGLALARSGALHRAKEALAALREEGHEDGETLGLLARTYKDLALATADGEERRRHLEAAFEIYAAGYRESRRRGAVGDAYYTGINAATVALLRDDLDAARAIAANVEELCSSALRDGRAADAYWPQATLAEAALILGNLETARQRYAVAAKLAGSRFGNLSSTRHQARLLLECRGEDAAWLDEVIGIPPVLVFSGATIGAPELPGAGFEPRIERLVRAEILAQLERIRPMAAYGSATSGADIICLECVRDLGGELHIVLPFSVEQFRATSVALSEKGQWGERFDSLLEDAADVLVVSDLPPQGMTCAYEYANLIIAGLARLRAQTLDTRLQGLVMSGRRDSPDADDTASVSSIWQGAAIPFDQVTITADPTLPRSSRSRDGARSKSWPFSYSIEAMLFADAVGYSRLTERQIPLFFEHYSGTIAAFNAVTPFKACHVETAGDGMYMVFDDPEVAGQYALGLSELMAGKDWGSLGLPDDLGIRIGLHCGPVFVGTDPITQQPLYTGVHTSRTARIEPITPPGQVYSSSAFAAITTARGVTGLRFSYIGRTRLAKDYGVLPLYHVKSC